MTFAPPSGRRRAAAALVPLLALLAGSLWAPPAAASRVRALSLEEMVAGAGSIFAGRVLTVEPDAVGDLPVSRVTFAVEEEIRLEAGRQGDGGRTLILTFLGGRLESGLPLRVAGMPAFTPGERVVLLAYPSSRLGLTAPVGLSQGRFALEDGPAGLQQVTAASPATLGVTGPGEGRRHPEAPASMPYKAFMETLRRLAAGAGP